MHPNVERLRALMARHDLSYADVAELAGASVKTVESWLAREDAAMHRSMPGRALDLIELRLKERRRLRRKKR